MYINQRKSSDFINRYHQWKAMAIQDNSDCKVNFMFTKILTNC